MKKLLNLLLVISISCISLNVASAALTRPTDVVVSSTSPSNTAVNAASFAVSFSAVVGAISYRAKAHTAQKDYISGPFNFPANQKHSYQFPVLMIFRQCLV